MKVNKFHAPYQVLRVDIRSEKDPKKKVWMMRTFLDKEKTYENYIRLKNLARTTAMAYRDPEVKSVFADFIDEINSMEITEHEVAPKGPETLSTSDLEKVLKDLGTRKYDFQFKGKAPQDHVDFVEKGLAELENRSQS